MSEDSKSSGDGSAPLPMEAGRSFKLPVFEGPLDLLLHLIKRNELDPQEVTASIITEQYLHYLELLESLNLDIAGEYLVMASTLLLIKSFSLLPHPASAEEDEGEDLKRDLVERLLEYQRYREAAAKLGERSMLGRDVFASPGEKLPEDDSGPERYAVSLFDLVDALRGVLTRLAENTPREMKLRDLPVAQCIPLIVDALRQGRIEFSSLFAGTLDRPLIVATFLALLELLRRGQVRAFQEQRFGTIYLEEATPPTPAPVGP